MTRIQLLGMAAMCLAAAAPLVADVGLGAAGADSDDTEIKGEEESSVPWGSDTLHGVGKDTAITQVLAEAERVLGRRIGYPAFSDSQTTLVLGAVDAGDEERSWLTEYAAGVDIPLLLRDDVLSRDKKTTLIQTLQQALSEREISAGVGVRGIDARILVAVSADESIATTEALIADLTNETQRSVVDIEGGAVFTHTDVRDERPPRGNSWLAIGPSGGPFVKCSLGFTGIRQGDATKKIAVTAGHCPDAVGEDVRNLLDGNGGVGQSVYGSITRRLNGPESDVARFSLSTNYDGFPAVFVSPTTWRRVSGNLYEVAQILNMELCAGGRGTWDNTNPADGERCADLDLVGYNLSGYSRPVNCIGHRTWGGDSGGAVYQIRSDGTAKAAGTTTGLLEIGSDDYRCFVVLDDVEDLLDVNIRYQTTP